MADLLTGHHRVLALVLVAGLTVVGCSTGPPVLGSDFRAKVLAACAKSVSFKRAMGSIAVSNFNPTRPDPAVLPSIPRGCARAKTATRRSSRT